MCVCVCSALVRLPLHPSLISVFVMCDYVCSECECGCGRGGRRVASRYMLSYIYIIYYMYN